MAADRAAAVRRVLWITLLLNLAVAAGKLLAGSSTSTLSIVADGFHSLLDSAGNIMGLIVLRVAHRPPDAEHQYGHRKIEVIASVGISLLLFVAAVEIAMSAARRFGGGTMAAFSGVSVGVMLATMAVNLGVSRYEAARGKALGSPFLIADARHTRSDLYASSSVLVALLGLRLGIGWLDPAAAAVIAAVILLAAWRILRWSLGVLADERLLDPAAVEGVVMAFPDVRSCAQVRTRGFADAVFLDLKIGVDPGLPLHQAHALCDRIEARLKEAFPELADIVIHPEPAGEPSPVNSSREH